MGWSPVIIDNTNTQAWQMLPYVRLVSPFDHSDYSVVTTLAVLKLKYVCLQCFDTVGLAMLPACNVLHKSERFMF